MLLFLRQQEMDDVVLSTVFNLLIRKHVPRFWNRCQFRIQDTPDCLNAAVLISQIIFLMACGHCKSQSNHFPPGQKQLTLSSDVFLLYSWRKMYKNKYLAQSHWQASY